MTYVALLRGINVGGHANVEMTRLKQVFIALGFTNVSTYINSGNVIFSDPRAAAELVRMIEAGIVKEFGFAVPVVVCSSEVIHEICQQIPTSWTNDSLQKSDVYFLRAEIDSPELLEQIKINQDIESVRYCKGILFWNVSRENAAKSQAHKLTKTSFYRSMTIRNVNTVRRIDSLMQALFI